MINTKFEDGLGDLAAVRERIALFHSYANEFAVRLSGYLSELFEAQADAFLEDDSRAIQKGQSVIKLHGHEQLEEKLFRFKKLLVWLKDTEARIFHELQLVRAGSIVIFLTYTDFRSIHKTSEECILRKSMPCLNI